MEENSDYSATNKTAPKLQATPVNSDKALKYQAIHMLHNASVLTEMAIEMKEKCEISDKLICLLRNVASKSYKTLNSVRGSSKTFLISSQKLLLSMLHTIENAPVVDEKLKYEYEKLLNIIERELSDMDDIESPNLKCRRSSPDVTFLSVSEKIRTMEERQKLMDSLESTSSRSFRSEVDEKYPDKWMKETVLDLDNVITLPPVPEDAFTCFTKTRRTSSVSSFKNVRKMQMYFHRAESTSDEDDESEFEDASASRTDSGENEERDSLKSTPLPRNSTLLNEIKEEDGFVEENIL